MVPPDGRDRDAQSSRMSAPVRIVGFAVLLAVIFAAAALAGAKLDPAVDERGVGHEAGSEAMGGHESSSGASAGELPGLAVADAGYRLVPARTSVASGPSAEYAFRIVGPDGETVRDFEVEHERRMHLIVVRRDFEGFQHLHPEQLADGTWAVELDARLPGVHRVFADFATAGRSLTLGTDLFVPGGFEPEPLPPMASTANAGDGYEVAIDAPSRGDGADRVRFTITRNGRRLRSVEPYLGADGHLVALREHDQAFLHTHPEGKPGGRGPISFQVEYPSAGRYRLFLQFKHAGEVRTAAFTREVTGSGAATEEASDGSH
jgi:hypothetical protein